MSILTSSARRAAPSSSTTSATASRASHVHVEYLYEEFTRLAETRLAQNILKYIKLAKMSYLNIA